jgi:pyridoxal phosphate enzyme (YggS family)
VTAGVGVADRLAALGVPAHVRVVAVTKGQPAAAVSEALAAGLVDLGENYAQELLAKLAAAPAARWHFLGHVQSNKVRALADAVTCWQAIDGLAVGAAIVRRAGAGAGTALVQVNLSGAAGRNGCDWEDAGALVGALREVGLDVRGLMGVAGQGDERDQFRRLADLSAALGLAELSMGMSGDWEVAVEEGATMIRLGTALFGPRTAAQDLRR